MIPPFSADGLLAPGVHPASWEEFEERFGWNEHRRFLIRGLRAAARALAIAGCKQIYVDGSFVTDKELPGDFDGCWEEDGVNPYMLDPVLLSFENERALQKAKYAGEFFPAHVVAEADSPFRQFVDFFQHDLEDNPKGIVSIDLFQHRP